MTERELEKQIEEEYGKEFLEQWKTLKAYTSLDLRDFPYGTDAEDIIEDIIMSQLCDCDE